MPMKNIESKWKNKCCGRVYKFPEEMKFCLECGKSLKKEIKETIKVVYECNDCRLENPCRLEVYEYDSDQNTIPEKCPYWYQKAHWKRIEKKN